MILTVKSLQSLLLSCIDKSPRAYSDRLNIFFHLSKSFFLRFSWCKILRVQKLEQIVVVVVNGITDRDYIELKDTEEFRDWKQLFTSVRK